MTAPIVIEAVEKAFGEKAVLRGVSAEIQRGEIFGILGPSGAGKTTVLRLVDLLLAPDAGRILFHGTALDPRSPEALAQRRRMAMIMQNPATFRASVFENVAFGLWLRGADAAEVRARVFQALEFVGLLGAARERADRLSGGEQQRIAFARAAVLRPEVLLLDEFTANLDPANVRALEEATLRYRRETGCTVVIVTHNLFQAKRLADRAALLLDGRLVEVAPAKDIFENPQRAETRAFLTGEMAY
ncbi:MAG: hypothetical protein A3K66_07670 [Euryarchaeota archaeon RBG_16_67_27]|nr:MAG: hypothetical protein A3K66_07670 [Euryarchaeota archaeon RBG_16_67_27]